MDPTTRENLYLPILRGTWFPGLLYADRTDPDAMEYDTHRCRTPLEYAT